MRKISDIGYLELFEQQLDEEHNILVEKQVSMKTKATLENVSQSGCLKMFEQHLDDEANNL